MSSTMRLLASFVALMMAMGIGRFALTPQLPHLISEGQISLTAAGLVAAANYLGYLLGALDAMFAHRPAQVRKRLLAGLWLQAAGVLACLLGSGAGLALGVLLCGTPFLACMQLVMQRSRELAPHATHRNAGLLTTCFALGQLSGPLLAALSNQFSASLQPALVVAASGLIIAGALLLRPATGRAGAADACVPTARH